MNTLPLSQSFNDSFVEQLNLTPDMVADRSIGDLLRNAKNLDDDDIEFVMAYQAKHGVRFGDAAIATGVAEPAEVLWALAQQFHYPYAANRKRPLHRELVIANSPFSDKVEAFRDLRAEMMAGPMALTESRRVLAVCSSDSGDGKSFIAANLAGAFSQLAGRTLLIDANMRSPRMQRLFDIEGRAGLSSILAGRVKPAVLRPVADLPNLHVMPVGAVPPNPLELLQQPAFLVLVSRLASKFDYVIVDTPATSYGADATVVAATCGAALIVGRKGRSRTAGMESLVAQLQRNHTRIAGVVMNEF